MLTTELQSKQVERLAVGVYHLLLGKAVLDFPTSTKSHPSYWVTVSLQPEGALWPAAMGLFPFRVRWDIWERVVVPVMRDDTNQFFPNNGASKNWVQLAKINGNILSELEALLSDTMQATGYQPAAIPDEVVLSPNPPIITTNPEDVQQQAELVAAGGMIFEKMDTESDRTLFIQFDMEIY